MFHEKWEHKIKYEIDSLQNELRNEIIKQSKFGQIILENLNQTNGFLKGEYQKKLWNQILNKSSETEFLFLELGFQKNEFEILLETAKELKIEFQVVLNLFMSEKETENKARNFSRYYKTLQSIPEEEFVKKILEGEQRRISKIEEVKKLAKIVNINSDCSESEIIENILKEIKTGYNNV